MDYKLTVNDNKEVEIIKKAGSCYVRTVIPEGKATGLIETATSVEPSNVYAGFGIALNGDEMYIAGKLGAEKAAKAPKVEKAADEPEKAEKKTVKKTTAAAKKTTKN